MAGIGTLALNAISSRDYPLIQATVTITSIMIIAVNLVVDVLYSLIDPRIKTEK